MQVLRAIATEFSPPKTVELEIRVSRLEMSLKDTQEKLDLVAKRLTALQAQIDHFVARLTRV